MKVLSDMYEKPSANNKIFLMKKFWKPMGAAISNSIGSAKLKFNDVRDRILVEEVCRIDSGEASTSSSTLNLKSSGIGNDKNYNWNKGISKASFHTTTHQEIMGNYVYRNYGNVYLADDEPLHIVGVGDICLKMSNGYVWKIYKVRHVLKLTLEELKVKCLKSDKVGGMEYNDDDFKWYWAENGNKITKTIPGKPQQNGVRKDE
ncbi:hypothetical protein AAG906_018476 [Vitis piasezkii]